MTRLVACVLALDGWARTIESAHQFGLEVVVGTVDGEGCDNPPGVACHAIVWCNDFSDCRKMILETGLLDLSPATLRLNWRRLRSLTAPSIHFLPGGPAYENEDSDEP